MTTRVDCADFFELREAALKAHATQVDPEGTWFAIPRTTHQQVWPTEDFELVASRIPFSLPEDDLFAGVTPGQSPGELVWRAPVRGADND